MSDVEAGDGVEVDEDADGNTVPAATAKTVLEYLVKAVVEEPEGYLAEPASA